MALMRWCCILLLTTSSLAQVLIRSGVRLSSGVKLVNAPLDYELPTLVQITSGARTAVFGQAQNRHDLIVAIVGWNSAGSEDVLSVSDTSGNAYQRGAPVARGSALSQTIWYAKDIKAAAAGANTLTVTFTGNPGAPVDTRALECS